jgi:phosphohistidine swiveling domain-containing protein
LKNIFTSKANVLNFLQNSTKKSTIEPLMYFTITDWKNDPKKIISKIQKLFKSSKKIIIRSSALGEDSVTNSFAGTYSSILDISPKTESAIRNAIKSVIKSYEQNSNFNPKNQILIQKQSVDINQSGVIFTVTPDIGAPYYVINYEVGGTTTKTTQGLSNKTIKIFRNSKLTKLAKHWKSLILSIKELEKLCNSNMLDIEFGITNSYQIIIFQVRPLTSINNTLDKKSLNILSKKLESNKKKYLKLGRKSHIPGNKTIFSDMSDWNPAEIIGNNPNNLDYSLYDYLITKNVWHKSREILGYQNINPYNLMVKFGNKPYVDIRGSFNSFIPKNFSRKLTKKILDFYFLKLIKNPHLHDKVEFEILFTCYDFVMDKRLDELKKYNFSLKEISEIKDNLFDFTKNILINESQIISDCQNHLDQLIHRRNKLLTNLDVSKLSHQELIIIIKQLLDDCKNFGTLPFSIMARLGFIGTILLKSFQEYSKSQTFFDSFLSSLSTPLTEIQNDLIDYKNNKISKDEFLSKYGHLRPGTYDITKQTYFDNDEFLSEINFNAKIKPKKFKFNEKKLSKFLSKEFNLPSDIDILNLISTSIVQREKFKFEFSKNLSKSIELIALLGKNYDFTRSEISNLEINFILKSKNYPKSKIIKEWKEKINTQKNIKTINNNLVLPQIITSKHDFDIINYPDSKPNFITNKIIKSHILELKNDIKLESIKNSIILIENADPGFDWIFTKKPAGLITKYGGVASHMAIRCAEIGLPATIGCGELLYEKLKTSLKIQLDCKHQQIFILEHKLFDNYIEERKILKSLGYIK